MIQAKKSDTYIYYHVKRALYILNSLARIYMCITCTSRYHRELYVNNMYMQVSQWDTTVTRPCHRPGTTAPPMLYVTNQNVVSIRNMISDSLIKIFLSNWTGIDLSARTGQIPQVSWVNFVTCSSVLWLPIFKYQLKISYQCLG